MLPFFNAVKCTSTADNNKHPARLTNTVELSWQRFAFALRHVTGND